MTEPAASHRGPAAEGSGKSGMRWASAVSERVDTRAALEEAVSAVLAGSDRSPDLVLAFVSAHHAPAYESLYAWLREAVGEALFVGTSAAGVIGAGRELEGREALSLTAAWLPDTLVRSVHLRQLPDDDNPHSWSRTLGVPLSAAPCFLVLADPGSCDSDRLLRCLDTAFPRSVKIGGLMSGGEGKQTPALLHGSRVERGGALLLMLDGPIELTTIVAQGCRPVGEPLIVTRSRGNIIQELNAGKPADVLRGLHARLPTRDLALFDSSLFLGLAMTDKRGSYEAGDFLIRNILGVDRESGAMATDARLGEYQVVQFHMRDRESAAQDLAQRLRQFARSDAAARARGALVFSCVGRGERLYGVADHDSDVFQRRVGAASLAGCFCNGEIGPVAGKTFVHGYTSVFAVFSERG
ncbi:MAG TPA: FIST N-terminal domain-containing protein [Polyangiales bacterium]